MNHLGYVCQTSELSLKPGILLRLVVPHFRTFLSIPGGFFFLLKKKTLFLLGGGRKLTWILKNGGLGKVTPFKDGNVWYAVYVKFLWGTFSFGNPAVLKRLQLSKLLHPPESADSINLVILQNFQMDSSKVHPLKVDITQLSRHSSKPKKIPFKQKKTSCLISIPENSRRYMFVLSVPTTKISSRWWLNQPVKNMLLKMGSSSPNRPEKVNKYLKPPPSSLLYSHHITGYQ